ncbi:MAG TPA: primosomal protein N' [Jatrophihabitans sp.]|nr:primosomal protein N' [Jatrophihabitans sp.]
MSAEEIEPMPQAPSLPGLDGLADPAAGRGKRGSVAAGGHAARSTAAARSTPAAGRPPRSRSAAERLPVARVAVDSPLPHLDRPFDYLVPAELSDAVQPGSRVRVRFAGRLVDAWVLQRLDQTEHDGRLAFLERGVGELPVLTAETGTLFRAVADRWAGSFADVVRLAVPPRHARAESSPLPVPAGPVPAPDPMSWRRYRAGPAFLTAGMRGAPARAVWHVLPDEDWPARIAEAVQAVLSAGRGAVVVVPDARDLSRVDAALTARLPGNSHVALSADLGPEARYRRWLAVRQGAVKVVVGTRSAVFAPVAELGLIVVWDDGDDLLAEPRAPYPHARDVAVLRSSLTGAALLLAGFAETAESALLRSSGWAQPITADRNEVRRAVPRVIALGDEAELERDPLARAARLPTLAFRTARTALAQGRPVLIQVPRRGYLPALACARDRQPARCQHCGGPLAAADATGHPGCRWCGRSAAGWRCPKCGGAALRAVVVGAARTAEELGRAFPGTVLRTSAGDTVLAEVPPGPSLVVATPGAEPAVAGGYGAGLLLDGWALLGRPDLRAGEEAVRRWANAIALVRNDGAVVIGADAALAPVQALIRWDPGGAAERELADRQSLRFPPIARLAALTGTPAAVAELLALSQLPASADELGSVPVPGTEPEQIRSLLRVPRGDGVALAEALHAGAAIRSARKSEGSVRVVLDPLELL